MKKYSEKTLQKRLKGLEERLYNEKLKLHRMIDDMGWGAGMRRVKCTPSFRKENELQKRIDVIKDQLKRLDENR